MEMSMKETDAANKQAQDEEEMIRLAIEASMKMMEVSQVESQPAKNPEEVQPQLSEKEKQLADRK